jgi:hypothetical protein
MHLSTTPIAGKSLLTPARNNTSCPERVCCGIRPCSDGENSLNSIISRAFRASGLPDQIAHVRSASCAAWDAPARYDVRGSTRHREDHGSEKGVRGTGRAHAGCDRCACQLSGKSDQIHDIFQHLPQTDRICAAGVRGFVQKDTR